MRRGRSPTSCRSRRRAMPGSRATTWRWTVGGSSTSSIGAGVCTSWSGFSRHLPRFTRAPVRCLRGMNNRTDRGFLVLADVSGFTAFVTTTELEHGSEIIATLLDEVIARLSPPLEIQEIEGDAVFALAGEAAELPRTRLLEVLEEAFAAFKARQQAMQAVETCQCGACQQVAILDLKMVVHHGPFLRHTVAGRSRVTGTAVILVHRLLKNGVGRKGGYALLTEPVLRSLGIDGERAGLLAHTERYEHLGDVRCFVRDLAPIPLSPREREQGEGVLYPQAI